MHDCPTPNGPQTPRRRGAPSGRTPRRSHGRNFNWGAARIGPTPVRTARPAPDVAPWRLLSVDQVVRELLTPRTVQRLDNAPAAKLPTLLRRDCDLGAAGRMRVWEHDGRCRVGARPAAHPGIELAWIETGEVHYQIGAARIAAGAGTVVVVPTWVEHVTTFEQPVRGIALQLDPGLVAEIGDAAAPASGAPRLEYGRAEPGSIPSLVTLLEREAARRESGWRIAADALVEAIVVQMLRAAPATREGRGARDARIAAALEAIESRYAEPLSVDDLARAAGMSRFHFSRLFREQIGEAPYQHLLRVRIGRALELLRNHRRSVTEAALEVGFQDLGRFSRLFRAQVGCLPSELRGKRASSDSFDA